MFKHAFTAIALGAGVTAALTACTAPTPAVKPASAPTAPAPKPSSTTKYTGGQGGDGSADGCPTTATVLLKALEKTKYLGPAPAGQTLAKIRCYDGWAIASRETPKFDSDIQTLRYDNGHWVAFVGGSGGYCKGVPAGIVKYFQAHDYEGCGRD
jgi:hypothetical protein